MLNLIVPKRTLLMQLVITTPSDSPNDIIEKFKIKVTLMY